MYCAPYALHADLNNPPVNLHEGQDGRYVTYRFCCVACDRLPCSVSLLLAPFVCVVASSLPLY